MLVHGAILPPRTALEAVTEVVHAVPVRFDESAAPAPKGFLGRLGRGRTGSPAAPAELPAMLEFPALGRIQLLVTEFGNLTTNDARGLAEEIAGALQDYQAPTVRFAGGTALDFPGDWSVWAKLAGEIDELAAIAREVTSCVERLGLFVDRRIFRPMVPIATVTTSTTGPYLESVVDALEGFEGEDWEVALSLTKETFVGATTAWAEFQRVPFGA